MKRIAFALVIASALVALTTGCDEPGTKLPTGPDTIPPKVDSVQITGPTTLAPGQSAQFHASVRLSDGSLKTAPPGMILNWSIGTSFFNLLQVNQAGVVTALSRTGESILIVNVRVGTQTRTATREIVVTPEGTFRMVGKITEVGFPTQAIGGARVEVAQSTVVTTADVNGQYRLYGVPASAVIRVTATGYADHEEPVLLTSHVTRHFQLGLSGPRAMVNGPYTLAIDVTSPCPNGLVSDLQHRRYDAFLTQNGPTVEVELTEPRFRLNSQGRGNKFTGRATGNSIVFTLRNYDVSYYYYYYYYYFSPNQYPDVAERLPDSSYLVIGGLATTNLAGTTLSGVLSGSLSTWSNRFPSVPQKLNSCSSPTHQFVLTPR